MQDFHQEYVDKFIELGQNLLLNLGFKISVLEVNGCGNAGLTRLLLSHKSGCAFYVQFQDNRLDYTSGVMVYEVVNGGYDVYSSVLPKRGTMYNYSGPNRDEDIVKLIKAFSKIRKVEELQ